MSEGLTIFLAGVALALLSWVILLLLSLNDKITSMLQWREGHEESHDKDEQIQKERHDENLSKFNDIFDELRRLRRGQVSFYRKE